MIALITTTVITIIVQVLTWHFIKAFVRKYKVKKRSADWFIKESNLNRDFWAAFAPFYGFAVFLALPEVSREILVLKLITGGVAMLISIFFASIIFGHLKGLSLRRH